MTSRTDRIGHSQYGQDALVLELLNNMQNGFFLDTGAADGVRSSNTLLLEKDYGWRGVCVEPNDALYERLTLNRKCDTVRACLYGQKCNVEFVEAGTLGGILGEYHPSVLDYVRRDGRYVDASGEPVTVRKETCLVGDILDDFRAPKVIDYWSLDTEGSELAILKSFPFDRYAVTIITVEHNYLPAREEISKFLLARGYQWIRQLNIDDCYIRADFRGGRQWRSKCWAPARRRG